MKVSRDCTIWGSCKCSLDSSMSDKSFFFSYLKYCTVFGSSTNSKEWYRKNKFPFSAVKMAVFVHRCNQQLLQCSLSFWQVFSVHFYKKVEGLLILVPPNTHLDPTQGFIDLKRNKKKNFPKMENKRNVAQNKHASHLDKKSNNNYFFR